MRQISRIENDLSDMFDRFFDYPVMPLLRKRFSNLDKTAGHWLLAPKVDMYEEKDKVVVKAELPGVEKKDIKISVDNDILTIKGEFKKEEKVKNEDYHYSERSFGSFARHLRVPSKVDEGKVKANFKDGILEINIPLSKKAKEKAINIEVS